MLAAPPPPSPEGLVLTDEQRERVRDLLPDEGFGAAADTALGLLQGRTAMDLWLVTRVREGEQVVVAARGTAGMPVPSGAVQPWTRSWCQVMVSGEGPRVAPRLRDVPAYAALRADGGLSVRAYIGVPLLTAEGALFGTLCGLSASEQPESLRDALPEVEAVARLLSTVLAREAAALERSHAAAEAYALVERDALTGLPNRRAWEQQVAVEEQRCRRGGIPASVLVVELAGEPGDELVRAAAVAVRALGRPMDVVARTGAHSFGVVAVGCDGSQVRTLRERLVRALHDAGVEATVGAAARNSRDGHDGLAAAERDAVHAARA